MKSPCASNVVVVVVLGHPNLQEQWGKWKAAVPEVRLPSDNDRAVVGEVQCGAGQAALGVDGFIGRSDGPPCQKSLSKIIQPSSAVVDSKAPMFVLYAPPGWVIPSEFHLGTVLSICTHTIHNVRPGCHSPSRHRCRLCRQTQLANVSTNTSPHHETGSWMEHRSASQGPLPA